MLKIDNLHHVEVPEGVDLQAELAGLIPRALAYLVDFFIRSIVLFVFFLLSLLLGEMGQGIWLILFFLAEWWYPVYFELFREGQTPGKKWMGIRVVSDKLIDVNLQASLIRNLLRTVDFLPLLYLFGIISLTLSNKFQRLGDLAAGTIVIYKPAAVTYTKTNIDVTAIAPPHMLTEEQQLAIIRFTQHHKTLSHSRQLEMADILQSLIPKDHPDPVSYLQGVGKWLLGEQS